MEGTYIMKNEIRFRRFGTMIDCSRNAVMTVASLKKWIDLTSDLGYNALLLYTEDTYEVDGHPYFGYMRGRYTKGELQEIDSYAMEKGMELIPCIQTLAHLTTLIRWPEYDAIADTADILLADEEKTYEFIDRLFASISSCYSSRLVNVGMDEAYWLGHGRYYELHGDVARSEILLSHLQRVADIGKKYGLQLTMWSDMFFHLATGSGYAGYQDSMNIDETVKEKIPDNVQLVYWCYGDTEKKRYDSMLVAHEKLKKDTWYAGGLIKWCGFTPKNQFTMKVLNASMTSCIENGIQDVILTLWGDNGGECSNFAMIPSLFYASELAKGNTNKAEMKTRFKEKFGVSFERFMLLDLPMSIMDRNSGQNPEKYLLYNDCFMGLMDSTLAGGENVAYAKNARSLALMKKHSEWGYLFEMQRALCAALAIKAELGVKTHEVYQSRDKEQLHALILEYKKFQKRLNVFYRAFRKQWYVENKPQGFEVQDIRIGGLMLRVKNCTERLQALYDGTIENIEELEEKQLDYLGAGEELSHKPIGLNVWKEIVSANVI